MYCSCTGGRRSGSLNPRFLAQFFGTALPLFCPKVPPTRPTVLQMEIKIPFPVPAKMAPNQNISTLFSDPLPSKFFPKPCAHVDLARAYLAPKGQARMPGLYFNRWRHGSKAKFWCTNFVDQIPLKLSVRTSVLKLTVGVQWIFSKNRGGEGGGVRFACQSRKGPFPRFQNGDH